MPKRRKRRKTKKRTMRRKNSWRKQPIRHGRASKKGWRKRGVGKVKTKKGYRYLKTTTGKRYKRKRKSTRGTYPLWRNQGKTWATTIAVGGLGMLGAAILAAQVNKVLTKSGASPLVVGTMDLTAAVIPVAASFALLKWGKKLIKNQATLNTVALGLGMSGIAYLAKELISKQMSAETKSKLGLSGYVRTLKGYTYVPMLDSYHPTSLGQVPTPAGQVTLPTQAQLPALPPGKSTKPYGLGLPLEERSYNEFRWQGVFDKSVFE